MRLLKGDTMKTDLATQLRLHGLPKPVAEYRFHPVRKWRFDWAYPGRFIGIEHEGGTYNRGRHVRPKGYAADCEKYNAAAILGWRVLRFTTEQIGSGAAVQVIRRALEAKGEQP